MRPMLSVPMALGRGILLSTWTLAPSLAAAPDDPTGKLLAADAYNHQNFGRALAVDGPHLLIGAQGDATQGSVAGAVYQFDLTTGQQVRKILASDGGTLAVFGDAVAVDGDHVLIGVPGDADNGANSGSAYLFDATTGQERLKLLPSDGATNQSFGTTVALTAGVAIVGAPGADPHGVRSGAVYFFDAQTGQQLKKWSPSDGDAEDQFGWAVAADGFLVLASAPYWEGNTGSNRGAVYCYNLLQDLSLGRIPHADSDDGDVFGLAIAMEGWTAVITAFADDGAGTDAGAAYVVDLESWTHVAKCTAADAHPSQRLGTSIDVWGSTLVVGCNTDSEAAPSAGAAYLFDAVTGAQMAKLVADDASVNDWLGTAVAIQGELTFAGCYRDDDSGTDSGSVYLFDTLPDTLVFSATPNPVLEGDTFSLRTTGGDPGRGNIVHAVEVNGVPTSLQVALGRFDPEGKHTRTAIVPSGLAGLDVQFRAIGFAKGGLQVSERFLVEFR